MSQVIVIEGVGKFGQRIREICDQPIQLGSEDEDGEDLAVLRDDFSRIVMTNSQVEAIFPKIFLDLL